MTLFKSKPKVNPSDTNDNEKGDEKKLYNSSIVTTDDDNCTITIIVPPTARPANSRYSVQYLKQLQNEQYYSEESPELPVSLNVNSVKRDKSSWKYIIIVTLVSLKLVVIVGLVSYFASRKSF